MEDPETGEREDTALVRTVTVVVYRVSIYSGSDRVVNPQTQVKAGQLVNLRGVVEPEGALSVSGERWDVEGDIIRDWVHTTYRGEVIPAQLDTDAVTFCWYNGSGQGFKTVTFNVIVQGRAESTSLQVRVIKPSGPIAPVARRTYATINNYGPGPWLSKGFDRPGEYGAAFTASPDTGGFYWWVQTGASIRAKHSEDGTQNAYIASGLDGRIPYFANTAPPYFVADSPGIPLNNPTPTIVSVNVSDVYRMYFMHIGPGIQVPVPVARVDWDWAAHVERPGSSAPWPTGMATQGINGAPLTDTSSTPSGSQPDPAYPTWLGAINPG